MQQNLIIAPSILSANLAKLGEDVDAVLNAGADWVHVDVMDEHYVPNLTFGPCIVKALRDYGITAPLDVHLMVQPVDKLIVDFAKAGASVISFHPEASQHVDRSLQLIRDNQVKAGLVFNPATSIECIEYVLDKLDLILVMSVNPGFGGQKFIPSAIQKIQKIRKIIDASGKSIRLAVDGGVTEHNIADVFQAGADTVIAGSAIFNTKTTYAEVISSMRQKVAAHG